MSVVELVSAVQSSRVATNFKTQPNRTLWMSMLQAPLGQTQNFSLELLHDSSALYKRIQANNGQWVAGGALQPIHYAVMRSENPDYFSLGGDLRHFRECIRRRDAESLRSYAMLCVDLVYDLATKLNRQTTTIALVQGRALGGGFEAALASDFLIAEEHSEFGFPEILFGLFPCTGGMSLLARRVGVRAAERMMSDGRIYRADELKQAGIVDIVCPKGRGVATAEKFIAEHARHRAAHQALQRARSRMAPLAYDELRTVVEDWVELAMQLPADDLRVMDMLIQMQGARAGVA